jgi:hypothetical membrane protein
MAVPMENAQQEQVSRKTAILAATGFLGPIAFTALVVLQTLLQPDYSHIALPISALAAWPLGWIQILNFFVFGVLMAGFAMGLHRGISRQRRGIVGPVLLASSAIGLLMAGAFPWRRTGDDFIVPTGHLVAAALTFIGAAAGLIAISQRIANDPRRRSPATYALASGLTMIVLFVVTIGLARADDAPLHPWAGLLQRLTLAVWFPCIIVLASRLWRVAAAR